MTNLSKGVCVTCNNEYRIHMYTVAVYCSYEYNLVPLVKCFTNSTGVQGPRTLACIIYVSRISVELVVP